MIPHYDRRCQNTLCNQIQGNANLGSTPSIVAGFASSALELLRLLEHALVPPLCIHDHYQLISRLWALLVERIRMTLPSLNLVRIDTILGSALEGCKDEVLSIL